METKPKDELLELVREAQARYERLPPEQKASMNASALIGYVTAELAFSVDEEGRSREGVIDSLKAIRELVEGKPTTRFETLADRALLLLPRDREHLLERIENRIKEIKRS